MANYSNENFFDNHRQILVQTPETKCELTVVAADVIDSYREYKVLGFDAQEELDGWWAATWAKADVAEPCELAGLSSIKAFFTCSYGPWNGHERTIVYAVETS